MTPLTRQYYHGFHLGACQTLSPAQLHQLQTIFGKPPSSPGEVLAGRQSVSIIDLEDIGSIAVKHYARGGLIRHINHCTYANWPQSRGEKEFHWLEVVRQIGLTAPRPIAFASTGRFIGQCWLVTATIPRHCSLIHISKQPDDRRQAIYGKLSTQIQILIRHGIWHRDLHPGNVLVDENGTPHVIDFDKARYMQNRRLLTAKYIKRWARAMAKYHLPPELAQVMTLAAITP
jgi:RIO-like serine/threonine protein kinase